MTTDAGGATPVEKTLMALDRLDEIGRAMRQFNAADRDHGGGDKACATCCAALDYAAAILIATTGSACGDADADGCVVERLRTAAMRAMMAELEEVRALLN